MARMRAVVIYLIVLTLLALSLGAGLVASDWPHWCARWHLCRPGWIQPPGGRPGSGS